MSNSKESIGTLKSDFYMDFQGAFNNIILEEYVSHQDTVNEFKKTFGYEPYTKSVSHMQRIDNVLAKYSATELSDSRNARADLFADRANLVKNERGNSVSIKAIDKHLLVLADDLEGKELERIRDGLKKEMISLNTEMNKLHCRSIDTVGCFISFVNSTLDTAADGGLTINAVTFDQWQGRAMADARKSIDMCADDFQLGNIAVGADAVKQAPSLEIPWVYFDAEDYKGEKISIRLGNLYNSFKHPKLPEADYAPGNQFAVLYDTFDTGVERDRWSSYISEHKAICSTKETPIIKDGYGLGVG